MLEDANNGWIHRIPLQFFYFIFLALRLSPEMSIKRIKIKRQNGNTVYF